jgi:TolA-binding protein
MKLALLLLLLCPGDVKDWVYRPGIGFVNTKTMEKKSPEEFFAYGVKLARSRETDDALAVFDLILAHTEDPALKERTVFKKAEALYSGSRFFEAYQEFNNFLLRYPESKLADSLGGRPGAKELQMDAALLLAREGHTETFLGLPILKTSKVGIDYLHAALQRYPREDFTDDYYLKLGDFFFNREEYDSAETEYKFLLEEYKETESAPLALLKLGEVGLKRFDSTDYDIKGLKDARRCFERFIEEAPINAKISPAIKAVVERELPTAREKVALINETEAKKEFEIGEYYRRKDRYSSAAVYYRSILRTYRQTTWAAKVRERMQEEEFQKFSERYANDDFKRADQELLRGGVKLAERLYRNVLEDFPTTPWADRARQKIDELKK